jgi:hypothetical protein
MSREKPEVIIWVLHRPACHHPPQLTPENRLISFGLCSAPLAVA